MEFGGLSEPVEMSICHRVEQNSSPFGPEIDVTACCYGILQLHSNLFLAI